MQLPGTTLIKEAEIEKMRQASGDAYEQVVASSGPEVSESPGIFGRMVGRLFGTDVEDPLPWTRTGTTIAGSITGGYLGGQIPGPPIAKAVGTVAGSVAGTVIGAVSPETVLEGLEQIGALKSGERERLGLNNEQLMTVLEGEALLDIATLGGVSAARLVGRGVTGILTGSNRGTRQLAEAATREGIALLPVQVGERRFARGFVSVMGRFPWVASGLKNRAERAMGQISSSFDGIPARLGPTTTFDQVSQNIMRDARGTAEAINRHFSGEFDNLLSRADMMGVTSRPVNTRTVTTAILKNLDRVTPQGVAPGSRLMTTEAVKDAKSFINRTTRLLFDNTEIKDQSLRRMDEILKTVDEKMVKVAKTGDVTYMQSLERLRTAVQADMLTNSVQRGGTSTPQSRALIQEFRNLDEGLTETVNTLFNSTTAKRLGATVNPTTRSAMFPNNPGTKGMDNLAQVIIREGNPQAIRELQRLAGPQTMRQLSNAVFNKALDDALVEVSPTTRRFDADNFARALGLHDARSAKFAQTEALLNASGGMRIHQVQELVEIARRASGAEIPDVSTFIARKATFGGIKDVVKTVIPFAAVGSAGYGGGLWGGAIAILGTRAIANMISDPVSARALSAVVNLEATRTVKRAAILRATGATVAQMVHGGQITLEEADNLTYNMREFTRQFDNTPTEE